METWRIICTLSLLLFLTCSSLQDGSDDRLHAVGLHQTLRQQLTAETPQPGRRWSQSGSGAPRWTWLEASREERDVNPKAACRSIMIHGTNTSFIKAQGTGKQEPPWKTGEQNMFSCWFCFLFYYYYWSYYYVLFLFKWKLISCTRIMFWTKKGQKQPQFEESVGEESWFSTHFCCHHVDKIDHCSHKFNICQDFSDQQKKCNGKLQNLIENFWCFQVRSFYFF